jgi:hypothetical protein
MATNFKLGKLDAVPLVGVCHLADYAVEKLPTPPNFISVPAVTNWEMFGNDQYGDCTLAGAAHLDMAWNVEVKERDLIPSEREVVKEYFSMTGGQDTGLNEGQVLTHWHRKGLFSYRIAAFAPVPHNNIEAIKQAIAFYGGCYFGVQLPESAQQQFVPGGVSTWSVVPGSPIEGGHAISGVGYNTQGIQVVTWGQIVTCTYDWLAQYLDEAYAILPKQFVQAGKGPALDLASLQADLAKL